ncbi:MAG: GGDEF domain-containing protein [Spirochaetes bacterium]|nr:GGDEF domain-containing protein [Spirochaetota bacterium]MBU0956950.1 GGDEF domain-containing protein [Spirochaetota bacterium]
MKNSQIILQALQSCDLFSGIGEAQLKGIVDLMHLANFAAGDIIFTQGQPGTAMYIVKSGHIVSMARDSDGNEREVYEFGPGRFFGEMSIIDNAPRSATCEALEDAELVVLDAIDFYRIVWEHAHIGVQMLGRMASIMAGWLDEASWFLQDIVRWGETARKRAVIDEVSGLFNRRFLEESMRSRLSRQSERLPLCSLLMLDIDNFHEINERFGSEAGDAVIASVGAAYSRLVPEICVAARLAGDEFAFFLPGVAAGPAVEFGELICRESQQLFLEFRPGPDAAPVRTDLSVSIGVACTPEHANSAKELYEAADRALFRAKETGRNRVVLSSSGG